MRLVHRLALAALLVLATGLTARAAPMTGLDILRQFNLVVGGNADIASDVGGRTVVGGNLTDGAQFYTKPGEAARSDFRGLTVYGNSTDRNAISINNGGGATIGGAAAGRFNLNGGGALSVNGSGGVVLPGFGDAFRTPLEQLSRDLAGLSADSPWSGERVLRASAGTGTAVFTIAADKLAALESFSIDLNGRSGAIINVIGNYAGRANFLNAQSLARDLLWNYVDGTSLSFQRQWGGTILAPYADVSNTAQVFGTLAARSLDADSAWWSAPFAASLPAFGTVAAAPTAAPEPAALALFGLALGGLVLARRGRPARG